MNEEELEKAQWFFSAINSEYVEAKEHREMLEWALNTNSQELSEKNKKLEDSLEKNIQINKALKKSGQNLKLIIDNLWEWLIVIWGDKRVIEINSKAIFLSGISRKKIIGKKYSKYLNFIGDNNSELEDFIHKTLYEKKEFSYNRNVILNSKNKTIPVFVTSSPLPYYSETWTGCVVVFRDATEERELEKLKDKFLSVASHELRTPLTVIRWYISLFLKWHLWSLKTTQQWYLQKIFNNIENLINMVNDMLDISKLEAKQMTFHYEKINITQVVKEEIENMGELFKQKKLQVTYSLDKVSGISDISKIQQVLRNLLSNAYKFSHEKWSIFIDLKKDRKTNYFYLTIKDTWIWIEKSNLWKLFKKFSQIWTHLHKTEKWTGLGLAICKEIVNGMKGDIKVKSIYKKYTLFSVILPLENKEKVWPKN